MNIKFLEDISKENVMGAGSKTLIDTFNYNSLEKNYSDEEILEYAMSEKFLKRSYQGKFEKLNVNFLDNKENLFSLTHKNNYRAMKTEMRDIMCIDAIFGCWRQYKQVYVFDKDFAEELTQTENVRIPLTVFHKIPYKCFYIDLEDVNMFPNFFGCFVYISISKETLLPNITVLRCSKQEPVSEAIMFSVYLTEEDFLKAGMVEVNKTLSDGYLVTDNMFINFNKGFIRENSVTLPVSHADRYKGAKDITENNVKEFMMFIMQAILYIGSYSPDIKKRDYAVRNIHKLKKTEETPISISDVGFKWGETIRKERKLAKTQVNNPESSHMGSHSPKASHVRRAHWHTYRIGKGRKETTVKWMPPIYVVGNKNKEVPITAHRVKK